MDKKRPAYRLPGIGMRIYKSALAVFLCFCIYQLRTVLFQTDSGPFYSCIAAVLCMQQYVSNSWKTAINRTFGTVIGAVMGCLFLLGEKYILPAGILVLTYFCISLMIIPLLYIPMALHRASACYITCVVFLSITVSHASDVSPYLFAMNRMLDTLIGIFISMAINFISMPGRKDKNRLFYFDLDGYQKPDGTYFTGKEIVLLNRLLERGAKITLATGRMPAEIAAQVGQIHWNLPLAVMHGAALYHFPSKTYHNVLSIPAAVAQQVEQVFRDRGKNCFIYVVIRHNMHIYYHDFTNQPERNDYERMRHDAQTNYVFGRFPAEHGAVSIKAIQPKKDARELDKVLKQLPCANQLAVTCRPYQQDQTGRYFLIEIFHADVSAEQAVAQYAAREGLTVQNSMPSGSVKDTIKMIRRQYLRREKNGISDAVEQESQNTGRHQGI